ncbi:DUF5134 domain-containing protein [Mycolicibacterium komossense]|jgi:hypothetical protein|uniref:DUF5134 domain-containing protein n=1 Tax=Mycolicibacterium komossense TaxID=1779 RepID=A0ABT3CG54_9MYCO|nr:DUF5134 domain-containing protein [Mycolicibacterium komossense]MCV7228471.1 DUF5134 domain-containing protein [Mycolicibacterium komossense]
MAVLVPWALTAVFATCAGLYLAQCRAARSWQARIAWSLHALMATAMIATAWSWGMAISPLIYVLVFSASALYFAYLGLYDTRLGHAFYHAAMMGSMVLMAVAMPPSMMPPASGAGAMAGMQHVNMTGGSNVTVESLGTPLWVVGTCGMSAALFFGAALRSFFVLIRGPQRPYANLLMTAGMGVAFAALIS